MDEPLTATECPNCNTPVAQRFGKNLTFLTESEVALINKYGGGAVAYCSRCGPELLEDAMWKKGQQVGELTSKIIADLSYLPIVTTHTPLLWDYRAIRMVTAQSVTGTGPLTAITSSIADFFGTQSDRYADKIKHGENLCLTQMRKQTLDVYGNAIIAANVTYAVVGSNDMVMICMTGTAVKLNNPEVLGNGRARKLESLSCDYQDLINLHRYGQP